MCLDGAEEAVELSSDTTLFVPIATLPEDSRKHFFQGDLLDHQCCLSLLGDGCEEVFTRRVGIHFPRALVVCVLRSSAFACAIRGHLVCVSRTFAVAISEVDGPCTAKTAGKPQPSFTSSFWSKTRLLYFRRLMASSAFFQVKQVHKRRKVYLIFFLSCLCATTAFWFDRLEAPGWQGLELFLSFSKAALASCIFIA